jgi:ADP-ribosyl-[dinitrogen reductase] hydrolase
MTRAPGRWAPFRDPDTSVWLRQDLLTLAKERDVKVLVTLIERHELDELGPLGREARRAGITWLHFPIADVSVPWDMPAATKLVTAIVGHLERSQNVVVHCWGGLGRAGTIAAACLVSRGLSPEHAIQQVRRAREGTIQTRGQELFVSRFAEAIAAPR